MVPQIHYNQGADLFTYLEDPSVFTVKEGCIDALYGTFSQVLRGPGLMANSAPGLGIKVNESLVRETAAVHSSEKPWRNTVWRGHDGTVLEW